MADATSPRLTLHQRWQRLRRSSRFPFVLFLTLLVAGGLSQVYSYWWGVRIQRMVARHAGSTVPYPFYTNSFKRAVGDRLIRPLEPINGVSLNPTSPIPVSDLALLVGTWSLTDLELWGPIESDGWRQVGRLRNLKEISACWQNLVVHDCDMEQLARLSKLKSLTLTEISFELRGLRHFARHPSLTRLGIYGQPALARPAIAETSENSSPGRQVPKELEVASLREFATIQTLKRLTLSRLPIFGDEHLLALTSMLPDGTEPLPSLTNLSLSQTGVTGDGVRFVNNLPSLEELELTGDSLGEDGLRGLKHNSTIQVLQVSNTQIGDRDVETLLTMPKLKTVTVVHAGITDQGLMRWRLIPHYGDCTWEQTSPNRR